MAMLLAHIAEVDARRLYVAAGYPSMHAYCVDELRFSDEAAFLRLTAARTARQFPALFAEVAEGRLHLTAIRLLAPHLTPENVDELIAASAHLRKFEIEELIAQRFAQRQVPPRPQIIRAIPTPPVRKHGLDRVDDFLSDLVPETPTAPPIERFDLRFSIGKTTHDRLRYAQRLLSHSVPTGDLEQLFDRALVTLIAELEKRKFAATTRPRPPRSSTRKRHIPAHVRREVWKRDQGQCTFVSETGHRCPAREFLEYDHVDPVARGGKATIERMRLQCRAHNQYEAERAFGAEFVRQKRTEARRAALKFLGRKSPAQAQPGPAP